VRRLDAKGVRGDNEDIGKGWFGGGKEASARKRAYFVLGSEQVGEKERINVQRQDAKRGGH